MTVTIAMLCSIAACVVLLFVVALWPSKALDRAEQLLRKRLHLGRWWEL